MARLCLLDTLIIRSEPGALCRGRRRDAYVCVYPLCVICLSLGRKQIENAAAVEVTS